VPALARKSPRVAEVLPLLYLHGLYSSDFGPALEQFLGTGHGLSATAFGQRDLSGTDYVYVWVDGIHLKVRLAQDKVCLLVMIGVRADGAKELIALDDGHRWRAVNSAHLVALVRAGAKFENSVLVERPTNQQAVTLRPHDTLIHRP
jgi:putative transposase